MAALINISVLCAFYLLTVAGWQDFGSNYVVSNGLNDYLTNYNAAPTHYNWYNYLPTNGEKVEIRFYYETLCPYCIKFGTEGFAPVIQKLHRYLDVYTYPYGNAHTYESNGIVTFKCQHGPDECYGNKLHACALDVIKNSTQALMYNMCMIGSRSNDNANAQCGQSMGIDPSPIYQCANSDRGNQLLKYYGEESKRAGFKYVPYVLINGNEIKESDNFMGEVCKAFTNPPQECRGI